MIKYDTVYCCISACYFRVHGRQNQRIVTMFFRFFPGKILNDDTALKEYKISDKNFVVVMVTKVRELQIFFVNGRFCLLNRFYDVFL